MQNSEDLVALALSLRRRGDFAAAREAARRAIDENRHDAAAWFNLGAALAGLGEAQASETAYRHALQLRPDYAEAWSNLGGLLASLGRRDEAIAAYRNGIGANDRLAPIWSNLCNLLWQAGRFGEAEEAGRRAAGLQPEFAPAWVNLANALMRLRRFDEAIDAYRKALALQPANADLHANLGVALRRNGLPGPAIDSLRHALQIDPSHGFASWNLANALLERGELAEGWRHYEARWRRPEAAPRAFAPKGSGALRGRVLIWSEQGIGDEILYAGMAAELASDGARVTLESDARLAPLFARSFPGVSVVPRGTVLQSADFDHVIPLGDLGALRRGRWSDFPEHRGYLMADAARAAAYKERLRTAAFVVGLAWRSSNPELGPEKSAPLAEWCPVLQTAGVAFVNLQYGDVDEECLAAERKCGAPILRLPDLDLHDDIDGLAALAGACDLIITTSNVTAHLAGALGRPAWVLLPRRIGRLWYWFHERSDSPWYPSITLIPQSRDGEWASAIAAAAGRLRAMLADQS